MQLRLLTVVSILCLTHPAWALQGTMECAVVVEECKDPVSTPAVDQALKLQKVTKREEFLAIYYDLLQAQIPYEIVNYQKEIERIKARLASNLDENKMPYTPETLDREKEELRKFTGLVKESQELLKKPIPLNELRPSIEKAFSEKIKEIKERPSFKDCGLSDEEIFAISSYTSAFYYSINSILRKGTAKELNKISPFLQIINSGLGKLAPYKGVVKRGTQLPEEIKSLYCKDCSVTEKAYLSSALVGSFEGKDQFDIQSQSGRYIAPLAYTPEEEEVIFLPGTKFKIATIESGDRSGVPVTVYKMNEVK